MKRRHDPFVVVSDQEAERAKAIVPRPRLGDRAKALLDGEVVWIPNVTRAQARSRIASMASKHGRRVELRETTRDGDPGCYVWLEEEA